MPAVSAPTGAVQEGSDDAMTEILPLVRSEEERFSFIWERTEALRDFTIPPELEPGFLRVCTMASLGRLHQADDGTWVGEQWSVEDARSALAVANLTPDHRQTVQNALDAIEAATAGK